MNRSSARRAQACYLCGELGADTRDHVPSRAFLPRSNYHGKPRITLPAHRTCNEQFSADEEYVRDLLAPSSLELNLRGVSDVLNASIRALGTKAGAKRREKFLEKAVVIHKRTKSGLYAGKALGIPFERERVNRVGTKIARGIIYHDLRAVVPQDAVICASIPMRDVIAERNRQLKKGNRFWDQMSSEGCLHDMFGDSIALRRMYVVHPMHPTRMIEAAIAVMLLTECFITSVLFPHPDNVPKGFKFFLDQRLWSRVDDPSPPE